MNTTPASKMEIHGLNAWFGKTHAVKNISLSVKPSTVLAIIGPSGCGKSTFVRCIKPHARAPPRARDRRARSFSTAKTFTRARSTRCTCGGRVGMVFQRPNVFPTLSIRENVLAGLKLNRVRADYEAVVERPRCSRPALWDEVKDRLRSERDRAVGWSAAAPLHRARALAVEPEVLLMDEPASATRDPIATAKIEELIDDLKERYTIIIVTHSMQQATRGLRHDRVLLHGAS